MTNWRTLCEELLDELLARPLILDRALIARAREGLEHLLAGYCDPGWSGSVLTLELHNSRQLHPIALWPGMKIGQCIFSRVKKPRISYAVKGHYNGDQSVTQSKGHM